jgi:hypothetical protein
MKLWFLFCVLPFFITMNCNTGKKKAAGEPDQRLRFVMRTLEKRVGKCDQEGGACANVYIRYPMAMEPNSKVAKNINDSIIAVLIDNFIFEDRPGVLSEQQLDLAAEAFIEEWKTLLDEDQDQMTTGNWEIIVEGTVRLLSSKIAAVTLSTNSYAGGAHPNAYITLLNFDLKTGKLLKWKDVITDLTALKTLAEEKFKTARSLSPDANLAEEGFFYDESFALPENFELQKEGILFFYNPYEAASYAAGPTDFVITYEALGNLVRKEVIF